MIKIVLLIVAAGVLSALWACEPQLISDRNRFLANFVNHEILNVYGVLVAITLANAAQVHLTLNRLEERRNRVYFDVVRRELQQDAFALVTTFCIAVVLLVMKGNVDHEPSIAAINASALWILLIQIVLTWDVFAAVMGVAADLRKTRNSAGPEHAPPPVQPT